MWVRGCGSRVLVGCWLSGISKVVTSLEKELKVSMHYRELEAEGK